MKYIKYTSFFYLFSYYLLDDNIKTNLSNGKIILINTDNYKDLKYGINYILSKGYNIVLLDDLLSETNSCKY